jgi:predicted GNAT family N-acyltransferase
MTQPVFTVRAANWRDDQAALQSVRLPVFVVEQKVDAREEFDAVDLVCHHILATDGSGSAIGTGRIDAHGKIGRMAVLPAWREHGVGRAILLNALELARAQGLKRVYLHAQVSAAGFYSRAGFKAFGDRFFEARIEHQAMDLSLALAPRESAI